MVQLLLIRRVNNIYTIAEWMVPAEYSNRANSGYIEFAPLEYYGDAIHPATAPSELTIADPPG